MIKKMQGGVTTKMEGTMDAVIFNPEVSNKQLDLMGFDTYLDTRWALVIYSNEEKVIICRLKEAYTPIEIFKDIFNTISELVAQGGFEKFIFDKRELRAFHQPSMEWYFIYWKKDVLAYGIQKHRKILPDELWFEKMVQIAKSQILSTYPDNIIHLLDIKYCKSIDEALKS
jgi:hypothetical protein